MQAEFRQEVEQRGFWRVHFAPLTRPDALLGLNAAQTLVESSVVRLRGWPYPFASNYQGGLGQNAIELHGDYVEGWDDWQEFREFWRMYRSSQYINYRGVHDDWEERAGRTRQESYDPSARRLRALGALYQVTEFFAFLARLKENGLYLDGVDVDISLRNSGTRALVSSDSVQMPFLLDQTSHASNLQLVNKRLDPIEVGRVSHNSLEAVGELFDKFGWNPSREQVASLIESYLSGRT